MSNAAIRKTWDESGFLDKVLNEAYKLANNQPEDKFKIIPVRLEPCDRCDHRLSMQNQYDLFDDFNKVLSADAASLIEELIQSSSKSKEVCIKGRTFNVIRFNMYLIVYMPMKVVVVFWWPMKLVSVKHLSPRV